MRGDVSRPVFAQFEVVAGVLSDTQGVSQQRRQISHGGKRAFKEVR